MEATVPERSSAIGGGDLGKRIYDDVMAMDSQSLFASCHDIFCKHENCPVLMKDADHSGFKELVRAQETLDDSFRLWHGPFIVGSKVRYARDMVNVEKHAFAQARASAVGQTLVPAVTD